MERARRLRKGKELDTVYQKGTAVSGPLLVVRFVRGQEGPTAWGFAVGKRIAKQAVARNRIRRRLREAARQLEVADGLGIVVTARAKALGASFEELRAELEAMLRRAGVLEEPGRC